METTKLGRTSRGARMAAMGLLCLVNMLPAQQMQQSSPAAAQKPAGQNPADQSPVTQEATGALGDDAVSQSPAPMATVQAVLPTAPSPLSRDEQILQMLNRFTYGPRPGDMERVRAEGLSKWLSDQLNPQRIDDSALDQRLSDYPAMKLPINRLLEQYPNNAMIRAQMAGRVGVPSGPGERAIYNAQKERYKDVKAGKDGKDVAKTDDPDPLPAEPQAILAMEPPARFTLLSKLSAPQLRMLRQQLPAEQRQNLLDGFTPRQVETLAALASPQAVVVSELTQTKLLRSIFSERQLQEVMVDFWLNHFNVYIRKNQEAPYLITGYERDTIRPHALGSFEQLLVATAMSPAMLSYLDNASSVGPHSSSVLPDMTSYGYAAMMRRPKAAASGLNENYARELMELHTLGVNGGYTQKDVTEVARVFTGWTLGRNFDGGQPTHAQFDPSKHEPGDKMVLGVKIRQNGSGEGMQVLHMLATSPQTAHFISTKLAVRFVSDDPPPAMIDRMTARFLATHGDIRQVLLAMITSPEFFTRDTFRAKVKTPQDYVISAVRASGADVATAGALTVAISDLGMPLYGMQTPNGYSMRADPWNSTASLVARMNFALALSTNRVAGVHTDWPAVLAPASGTPLATLPVEAKDKLVEDKILHVQVSDRTREAILSQMNADPEQQKASLNQISRQATGKRDALSAMQSGHTAATGGQLDPQTALAAGLIFGSPEFQRR